MANKGKIYTRLAVRDAQKCVGCQCCMFACTRRQNTAGLGKSCLEIKSAGGMSRGFKIIACRACTDPPCARVCPVDALKLRPGGGVLFKKEICIGCGNCRDACAIEAVFWDPAVEKPQICIHCGICAQYCPYGVLELEKREAPNAAQ